MIKKKLSWKDLSLSDFKVYFFSLFKAFIPKTKIKTLDELEEFIQTKSAWVSQVTLYSYLKTRMGTRYVLHFDNDEFMKSVNEAKWNIYSIALQDLTFFTFSYLKVNFNYEQFNRAKILCCAHDGIHNSICKKSLSHIIKKNFFIFRNDCN